MGLKVWSLALVFSLVLVFLIGLFVGFISLLNFAILISSIMILFAAYISLTMKDPMAKIPTPLQLEKMKRRGKNEDRSYFEPEEKI